MTCSVLPRLEVEREYTLTAEIARTLEERGVDAALEELTVRLHEEGERHSARARELAEAESQTNQTRRKKN